MNILDMIAYPFRTYQKVTAELKSLRRDNLLKLAILNSDIESGKIVGSELDAVTECLVNIRKKDTDKLTKGGA